MQIIRRVEVISHLGKSWPKGLTACASKDQKNSSPLCLENVWYSSALLCKIMLSNVKELLKRCTFFAVVGPFLRVFFKQICFPVFCHFWSTIITDRYDATPVEIHGIQFVVNNILEVFRCNAAEEWFYFIVHFH